MLFKPDLIMFDLSKKIAVVTGGGSGIGKAVCETLAANGARVYVFDVDKEGGENTANEIKDKGNNAHFVNCDVANQSAVKEALDFIFVAEGRIDLLINNAGISNVGKVDTTSEDDFDRVFQINVKGVYNCLKGGIPHMIASGGGAIINMSSIAAVLGIPDRFAYSMSKGAVLSMTYSVAKDYVDQGIRCNAIGPARVHTPFVDGFLEKNYPGQEKEMFEKLSKTQPIGRMGTPKEIAALVLYLCSDEASFATGTFYPLDGGFVTLNT